MQQNVVEAVKCKVLRAELPGPNFAIAQALALAHDWAARVVAATGNYGEIFQRTTAGTDAPSPMN
jgi:general L-amino acid transport system substrate-binding protein